jgi:glycosyltransferase involved in cell wall biosynthesis
MKNNHILFLHTSSDLYGADRSLLRTVKAIKNLSDNITVCLPYHGPLVSELEALGVKVKILKLGVLRRKYFNPIGLLGFALVLFSAYFQLSWLCLTHKTQIIHSNSSAVLVGGLVAKTLGITHLWHLREIHVKPVVIRKMIAWHYRYLATKIVGVSKSVIENLAIDYPDIWEKAIVINNGLNIDKYQYPAGKLRNKLGLNETEILIGMIARVSHWKGQNLFVEVAKQILPKHKNVHFLALGSPFQGQEYLMDEFKASVEKLNEKERFHIYPFASDVSDYLDAFDIFILPSTLPDPFPTTALEAMATRSAMVVNGQGGVLEMIEHEKSGFVVTPPNDAVKFVEYTEQLIENKDLRKVLGETAFEEVNAHFTEEQYQENISNLFIAYLEQISSNVST